MRIGIVSDVHGNEKGLATALELIGDVDRLLCLGDLINQHHFSNECVALLKARSADVIWGNHEEVFFGPYGQKARDLPWIDPELRSWLAARPAHTRFECEGARVLACHSTPWAPTGGYVTPQSSAFRRFGDVDADVVLYGHTHQKVAARMGRVLVINPGSAGQPQPGVSNPVMSCAVLELPSGRVVHHDYL
jgi:putative phosphoesterase